MNSRTRIVLASSVSLLALMIAGCSAEDKLFKPRLADSHYDAASTHVAVLSVAPWNDIVDKLQPAFSLTSDQALTKSLPTTQLGSYQLLEAFDGSLQVALPVLSSTRTDTITRSSSASETREVTDKDTSGPGTLPDLGGDPTGGRKAKDLPAIQLDAGKLGNEALLQYQTATALYQEVQILNNYVRYAVRRLGFTPYLVRLQVSVLPLARNEPYDVFADISFLPPAPPADGTGGIPKQAEFRETRQTPPQTKIPFVIPLLVTDDVEASLQSRAVEIVRQLQGALSGQAYNVNVAAAAGQAKDEIAAALGNDLNAVSTVARLNDNTARVRLGALNQATNRFGMVARANTVTLMVLVPDISDGSIVDVPISMRTRLRNATTGELLIDATSREKSGQDRQMMMVAQRYHIEGAPSSADCGGDAASGQRQSASDLIWYLSAQSATGDYDSFKKCAENASDYIKSGNLYSSLWADVSTFPSGYGYSTTSIEIKGAERVKLPPVGTLALMLDDTKQQAITLISGASGFSAEQVEASILRGPDQVIRLPATSIDRPSQGLKIVFPSPTLWQQTVKSKNGNGTVLPEKSVVEVRVPSKVKSGTSRDGDYIECIDRMEGTNLDACSAKYKIAYVAKAADLEAGFTVSTSVQTVAIEEKGQGIYTFSVKITGARGKVKLTGDGVVIAKVNGASTSDDDLSWPLTKSGVVTVSLAQLTPEQSFKLKLTDANGLSRDIQLTAKALTNADAKKQGAS